MSTGLPVILSDIPAHKAFINNNENGIFFKNGSSEDLKEKILELADNKNFRKNLGVNARNTVEKEYKWDKIASKYEKLYKEIDQSLKDILSFFCQ